MPPSDLLFSNYPSPRRMMDDGFILKLNHFLFSAHWILSSEDIIFLPRISFSGNICQKRTQSIYQFSRINIIYIIHCDYHSPDFFLFFFFFLFTLAEALMEGLNATYIISLQRNLSTGTNWPPIISSYSQQNIKTYLMQTLIMFSILSCQLLKVPEMLLFSEMLC